MSVLVGIIGFCHALPTLPFIEPLSEMVTEILTTAQAALLGPSGRLNPA
ncbi:hypothetical protein [Spirosoma endophyticum]|uniref:Uncharacterized protein n=1 Tax=Spirosoma endophyticum TaxID=662367 RepID=A0A1I2DPV0_9BACT|nr:hypothetical protein [Spirosoma endophyticum]SFE82652.1 hypothetical protein SAMN05216167_12022 [Spirosoma endophyticum]